MAHGRAAYGSDPHILGKTIAINGNPCEIVGVLPKTFSLPREVMPTLYGAAEQAEILLPFPLPPNAAQNRDHEDYNIIGKLKPGVTLSQAQAEMDTHHRSPAPGSSRSNIRRTAD